MSQLVEGLDFEYTVAQSAAEYFDLEDVHRLYSREVVESATRVNYAQVSMACSFVCEAHMNYICRT